MSEGPFGKEYSVPQTSSESWVDEDGTLHVVTTYCDVEYVNGVLTKIGGVPLRVIDDIEDKA